MANENNGGGNGNGGITGSGKMRTYQGYGYRFGDGEHVSFDPVIGGWPIEFQVDEAIELREVTRHQAFVNGQSVKMSKLEELGLVKVAPGAQEKAREEFRAARSEESLKAKAERAKIAAEKAVAKANEQARKAEEAAKKAQERAKLIAEGGAKKPARKTA